MKLHVTRGESEKRKKIDEFCFLQKQKSTSI